LNELLQASAVPFVVDDVTAFVFVVNVVTLDGPANEVCLFVNGAVYNYVHCDGGAYLDPDV